jgi:NitT/TauT family transport system permease protein
VGVLAWWAIARFTGIPAYILPSPGSVAVYAVQLFQAGALQIDILQTVAEVVQGVVIGAVLGVVLAIVFSRVPIVQRLLMPVIVVLQVTPKISIAPLIVLWLGLGIGSKLALVILVVFYPVLVTMLARLNSVPTTLRDLARVLGMGPVRRALRIDLPFSLPAIAAGLRVGVLVAVTAAVIGEFIGAQYGLGFIERSGEDNADIRLVLISLGLLCLLGWVLYAIVGLAERLIDRRFGGVRS